MLPMMMGGNNQDPMTKKSRELYIGNLPENVPEQQLMSFLNAALLQVTRFNRHSQMNTNMLWNHFLFMTCKTTAYTPYLTSIHGCE